MDVNKVDPIMNTVLNKEVQKKGGRNLMTVGDKDIDYNVNFMIILTTRNQDLNFSPDLSSRVTFINFTVTPASLE